MKITESTVGSTLRAALESRGALCEKLSGNLYQNGLPDLLISLKAGTLILVELKCVARPGIVPTVASALGLLRTGREGSRQFALCCEWGQRGSPVSIVIGSAARGALDGPNDWCRVAITPSTRDSLQNPTAWTSLSRVVDDLEGKPLGG